MKEQTEAERLKEFLTDNFDFHTLKKIRFFDESVKASDHEAQAARICQYFGLDSVFEYGLDFNFIAEGKGYSVVSAPSVGVVGILSLTKRSK